MNMLGSGFGSGLGIAGMFASDRRLKEDIRPTGQSLASVPLYAFRFKGSDTVHTGVMSDEVRQLHPDAVVVADNGYDMVDYGLLMRRHQNG